MKDKLYRFMYGRYGNDALNYFLLVTYIVLSLFSKYTIVATLSMILFFLALYRCMSKDIYRRRSENDKFMQITKPIRQHFKAIKNNFKDKEKKYFVCPNCGQVVRVPRHRGKIEISCPSCRTKFVRKS